VSNRNGPHEEFERAVAGISRALTALVEYRVLA
jgi:hypothetical protein